MINNLIDMFGKPDRIRIEVARDVGQSQRQREERRRGIKQHEKKREKAREALNDDHGMQRLSRDDIEKWLLWKESGHRCPYSGDHISFDALFHTGEFEVEHIWPRSLSLDDSFANKTLCRKDINNRKGNRIPRECFRNDPEEWSAIKNRIKDMAAKKGGIGMSRDKIHRFLADSIPENFAQRQLNDTSYTSRIALNYLENLWTDDKEHVHAVSSRISAHLRYRWGLNNILGDDGTKTRNDHRHHAIDALVVACCHQGMVQKLSRYWKKVEGRGIPHPRLNPPWESIRSDAERLIAKVIVSHRVRKKISGPLHKETIYGITGGKEEKQEKYRIFVSRKNVETLTKGIIAEIRDERVRMIVRDWVDKHGGDPQKAFPPYPKMGPNGPEIRKVRLVKKQQIRLMAPVSTGYSDLDNNHHMAIYQFPDGKIDYEVVSLHEAARRLTQHESIIVRKRKDGSRFVMSLSQGDSLWLTRDGETQLQVVESVWADGQVVLAKHYDATSPKESRFRPNAKSILKKYKGKKVTVDPIGRIRPAND